ncbi:MAG TPA: transposase [Candidatus Acidoferrales bacterium]|nr:transposase [Candidatus Acidoferrales bacterium]
MRTSRFKPEEVLASLDQVQRGVPVREISIRAGISESTLYNWKIQYEGLDAGGIRRLRQLEQENSRLRRILGVKDLHIDVLKAQLRRAIERHT